MPPDERQRRSRDFPAVLRATVSPAASVPVCDCYPLIHELSVENVSDETLQGLAGGVEADPPFFAPFPLTFQPIRPRLSCLPAEAFRPPEYDWVYLASLREPREATVRVTLGVPDAVLCAREFAVLLYPFWHWTGLGGFQESLVFHVRASAPPGPAAAVRDSLASRLGGGNPPSGYGGGPSWAWETLEAVWEEASRLQVSLKDPDGPRHYSGGTVLSPSVLAARLAGGVLDMAVLLASLLAEFGLNPLLVFCERRLFVGAWLVPLAFSGPWTEERTPFANCLSRGDLAVVDAALAGRSDRIPTFREVADLSAASFEDSGFLGVLDVTRAVQERGSRPGVAGCPGDVRISLAYPRRLLPPPGEAVPDSPPSPAGAGRGGFGSGKGGSGAPPGEGALAARGADAAGHAAPGRPSGTTGLPPGGAGEGSRPGASPVRLEKTSSPAAPGRPSGTAGLPPGGAGEGSRPGASPVRL
ncbi:MAG: hypothetical protein LBG06_04365, partial [Deltaproteobacteria bacterium]|nr:hypothetical protein [Deltaproteobacteria bacterium]